MPVTTTPASPTFAPRPLTEKNERGELRELALQRAEHFEKITIGRDALLTGVKVAHLSETVEEGAAQAKAVRAAYSPTERAVAAVSDGLYGLGSAVARPFLAALAWLKGRGPAVPKPVAGAIEKVHVHSLRTALFFEGDKEVVPVAIADMNRLSPRLGALVRLTAPVFQLIARFAPHMAVGFLAFDVFSLVREHDPLARRLRAGNLAVSTVATAALVAGALVPTAGFSLVMFAGLLGLGQFIDSLSGDHVARGLGALMLGKPAREPVAIHTRSSN